MPSPRHLYHFQGFVSLFSIEPRSLSEKLSTTENETASQSNLLPAWECATLDSPDSQASAPLSLPAISQESPNIFTMDIRAGLLEHLPQDEIDLRCSFDGPYSSPTLLIPSLTTFFFRILPIACSLWVFLQRTPATPHQQQTNPKLSLQLSHFSLSSFTGRRYTNLFLALWIDIWT
jgi:hypothetical protein